MAYEKRLQQELKAMQETPPPLCKAALKGDNLHEWTAHIEGPPDSPYEGGKFELLLKFSKEYPFEPPVVRFVTKIYHCNVNSRGGICVDILQDSWSPAMRVSSILLSICSLMTGPNPDNCLRLDIAQLYKNNRALYDQKAREYTAKYAMDDQR